MGHSLTLHPVLVVDDEPNILSAVCRELNTPPLGRYRYAIETCTDPVDALELAKIREFEVVITDYRMPGMDGLAFLKAFRSVLPHAARVVLSGQTDLAALTRMINETHIYRFIPKPWSSYFLKSTVAQAIDFYQINAENRHLAQALREGGVAIPEPIIDAPDHVLVVDDEMAAARSIARSLSQCNRLDNLFLAVQEEMSAQAPVLNPENIRVHTCTSAREALALAEEIELSCVIADFRMPDMDGAQLLSTFAEKYPDCATILISGGIPIENLVIALDLGHIHAFIAKPWVDFELRAAVAQSLARRRVRLENRLLAAVYKARETIVTDDA